jgi:adenosylcobinamide kinase/adenosylcobinamide-phosphate guanylyltransferase
LGARLTLVLGGARSGKSRYADVTALPPPWTHVATAQALDAEMAARVGWRVIEPTLAVASAHAQR